MMLAMMMTIEIRRLVRSNSHPVFDDAFDDGGDDFEDDNGDNY